MDVDGCREEMDTGNSGEESLRDVQAHFLSQRVCPQHGTRFLTLHQLLLCPDV